MEREDRAPEVSLPAATLIALRRALRKEAGPLATVHALHDAGYVSGDGFYEGLSRNFAEAPNAVAEGDFWKGLSREFETRGWGRLAHDRLHPALGLLRSAASPEADPSGDETQPGCAYTAGVLAHVLTRSADGPIAVLEVACRSRGDEECHFAFGSESAIHEVYGLLLEGRTLNQALDEL